MYVSRKKVKIQIFSDDSVFPTVYSFKMVIRNNTFWHFL